MDINSFVLGYQKGKASGGGGGSMEGFHMVRFFNDDRTTLLYTVFVPTGTNAIYAGETPVSVEDAMMYFNGFEPSPKNVMADMDCFAVYEDVGMLYKMSWGKIAEVSANGEAQNYFSIGDTKMIHIEGTVGTLEVNGDYGVYIIGFDHNEELEGKGIHFGTFKGAVANGTDICLVDEYYGSAHRLTDGTKCFNLNHWGDFNYGGWAGCDMRYDILGSTDVAPSGYGAQVTTSRVGYNATESCATNPVPNTLMAALPADLRAVMKPMVKYSNNAGGSDDVSSAITAMIDYLPLIAQYEISAKQWQANSFEKDYQLQYVYYSDGNSKIKGSHLEQSKPRAWANRTISKSNFGWCSIHEGGSNSSGYGDYGLGLAPIFKV